MTSVLRCCDLCFADKSIRHWIRLKSTPDQICPICKSEKVSLVACEDLRDKFEFLLEAYVVSETEQGEALHTLLQRDWALFAVNPEKAKRLLSAVLGTAVDAKYTPRANDGDSAIKRWRELRIELKKVNRFFPGNAPDADQLQFLSSLLAISQNSVHDPLFRARIKKFEKHLEPKDLKAPPADIVGNGRANPIGIPYLYVASKINTAVAEVRPSKGDTVYVGTFHLRGETAVVDLTDPRSTISPFDLESEQLPDVRSAMDFLCALGDELSSPALPHRSHIDYLASQYLCELVKTFGYDGVRYKSSVSDGVNYAFFDTEALEIEDKVIHVEVTEVAVEVRIVDE